MEHTVKYLENVTTLKLDSDKCIGCGKCLEVCPRGVFSILGGKAVIVDRDLCIECGACKQNCAFAAISVNAGVGCAQALFNAMITGGEPVCDCEIGANKSKGCC